MTALGLFGLLFAGAFALACSFVYLAPSLPTAGKQQAAPLRVYSSDGCLISQIGEQRSIPVSYDEIPELVVHAVLAAEDDRFFQHHGVDWMGVLRAVVMNVVSADPTGQGGSTITQQAARNMFLSLDQTARRKLSEVFVTYRMEREFSKEQILAIYLNVAPFGQRSVGIAAAAETYYGKHLDQLTVAQAATLVGVLPAPSRYNPVTNPKLAEVRRGYVLGRMTKLGYIDEAAAAAAAKEGAATHIHAPLVCVDAEYVAEMARQDAVNRFGPGALNQGYRYFTTIDPRLQAAANRARIGLIEYDQRHGYRGRIGKVQLPAGASDGQLDELLAKFESVGMLQAAVVTRVSDTSAEVHLRNGGNAKISWDGMDWAQPVSKSGALGPKPRKPADVVAVGDVVFVVADRHGAAELSQQPSAQMALVALDPVDGAVVALVGGFDFGSNEFNRVTQARRQPGSGFKPFLYSAALDNGYTPASIFFDLPPIIERGSDDEENWRPENSGGGFGGAMRLREGLVHSRNLVSIRIVQAIGVEAAIEHATKFGFRKESLPRNFTLALGTQSASPMEMATGYATFANGGFKVDWYFISRIEDATGKVVFEAKPKIACAECEQPMVLPLLTPEPATEAPATAATGPDGAAAPVTTEPAAEVGALAAEASAAPAPKIHDVDAPPALRELARAQGGAGLLPADRLAPRVLSAQNAWLMGDIMHDVATRGTAARTARMGRDDLAGKTGTTQESRDNWFNGFNSRLVASVWVGFDTEKSLGGTEQGGTTAVPIWMHFMTEALRNVPSSRMERPGGLVDLRISSTNGELADPQDKDVITETFMVELQPKPAEPGSTGSAPGAGGKPGAGTKGGEPMF
jgi:penicillin-binding protein 1A